MIPQNPSGKAHKNKNQTKKDTVNFASEIETSDLAMKPKAARKGTSSETFWKGLKFKQETRNPSFPKKGCWKHVIEMFERGFGLENASDLLQQHVKTNQTRLRNSCSSRKLFESIGQTFYCKEAVDSNYHLAVAGCNWDCDSFNFKHIHKGAFLSLGYLVSTVLEKHEALQIPVRRCLNTRLIHVGSIFGSLHLLSSNPSTNRSHMLGPKVYCFFVQLERNLAKLAKATNDI